MIPQLLLQPVILSGGSGTRLWPLSREKHPKQLLAIVGTDTMLQATALRVSEFPGTVAPRMMVVCNEEYRFITAEQLRSVGFTQPTLLLEPSGRNTAPALTLAALAATENDADAVLLIMPADHVISDVPNFHAAIQEGMLQAQKDAMVTFGIMPDRPETGYGYIQAGSTLSNSTARQLLAFVEKPNLATAETYLAGGNHLWNSGIFMVRASIWLKAITHFRPEIFTACQNAMQQAAIDCDFVRVNKEAFLACPSDSIDYAVMENLPGATELGILPCVIPFNAGWSDVGAWDAVWQVSNKDSDGNAVQGDVFMQDSKDCLVISENRLVTCLGMEDAIIIETADAVLVTNKQNTQHIKRIVTRLKDENYTQSDNHRKVYRPWATMTRSIAVNIFR